MLLREEDLDLDDENELLLSEYKISRSGSQKRIFTGMKLQDMEFLFVSAFKAKGLDLET